MHCRPAYYLLFSIPQRPPYDATVVSLLRNAGGQIVGKTNCDEFGMGSFNTNSVHGPVRNPFRSKNTGAESSSSPRSAGGSSGGSAAAVAADLCYAALGTDTGGSIRLPASYCGVVGLKPSYGLVSRWGVVSYADSLDCVGVIAKSVDRVRNVFDVICRSDQKDPTSIPQDVRDNSKWQAERSLGVWGDLPDGRFDGIRIGVPQEYFPAEMDSSLRSQFHETLQKLKERGALLVPVSLPSTKYALSAYYVLASAEASSNLARYDGVRFGTYQKPPPGTDFSDTWAVYAHSRSKGFGPEVRKRILLGTYALTADAFDNYYLQAQRIRSAIKQDFNSIFRSPNVLLKNPNPSNANGVDVLLHPTAISSAPRLGDATQQGIDGYVQDVLTTPASLAGLPCVSVPWCTAADGWPVGMSIVGQWGNDQVVLRVGELMEGL
ncbi:Trimeric GatFAB AmidoTransferase(AdT) complex subunit [Tulasnella sp. UAMH 9824]|nr:Trimeric GatFAB AmidoTransferase(AdT) complex subunit [Tulasnella sp. UAMH 9824]